MGHHFEDRDIAIDATVDGYDLTFNNRLTGERVRMSIPRFGAFEDPRREITRDEAEALAQRVVAVLRDNLSDAPPLAGSSGPTVTDPVVAR